MKRLKTNLETPKIIIEDPILDTEGVMDLTHSSRRTVQTWRDNGWIESSAVGGKYLYRLSAVNKMLENHKSKL